MNKPSISFSLNWNPTSFLQRSSNGVVVTLASSSTCFLPRFAPLMLTLPMVLSLIHSLVHENSCDSKNVMGIFVVLDTSWEPRIGKQLHMCEFYSFSKSLCSNMFLSIFWFCIWLDLLLYIKFKIRIHFNCKCMYCWILYTIVTMNVCLL